jgi:predicted RND superfamily exporter protein
MEDERVASVATNRSPGDSDRWATARPLQVVSTTRESSDVSETPPEAASGQSERHLNVAFGIERFGLLPIRVPALAMAIALLLVVAAAFGIERIQIDDSLSQLFRSNTPEFAQFEQVSHQFPSNEYDALVIVEGKDLLSRDSIEKLRSLVTDLQLIDGARGVISLFSARGPPKSGEIPAPLFPDPLPEGAAYDAAVRNAMDNDLVRGKLLSEDGTLALVVLALDPDVVESDKLTAVVDDIRKTAADDLADSGLSVQLSGVPVMQLEIRKALERDRLVYNGIGFLAGCAIAILFFRRASFMAVAAGPPLLAIVMALGALGWLGFRLNMFLNVMTPLIMVISFSDSMQLTFAARDRIMAGEDKLTAFRNAIIVVGPACGLSHPPPGLSFLALLLSDSDLIRTFGEAGFISTAIALVTVLSLVPVLGVLLVRNEAAFVAGLKASDPGVDALRRFCAAIASQMVRRPGLYSLIALVVVCSLATVYLGLQPHYRLADQVPDKEQAIQGNNRLDAKLTGANPIDVLIKLPPGADLYSPETLDTIAEVHRTLEEQRGIGNVWSPETLRRWLAEKLGKSDVDTFRHYIQLLPKYLVRRFVSQDQKEIIVSGRVPDKDASRLLPIVDSLDTALNAVRATHPGYTIAITGLSVIAARNSAAMISRLNRGLTLEFAFIAVFIGLAFRSLAVMLASVLPGVFPVVAAGALLRLIGDGLQLYSVVALTVSFGLGLSATIQFMNRMWREDRADQDPAIAVQRATVLVGPALIITSIVLACGLAALYFSSLPPLRLFGWLSSFAMLAALVADFLILRPAITFLMRLTRRDALHRGQSQSEPRLSLGAHWKE